MRTEFNAIGNGRYRGYEVEINLALSRNSKKACVTEHECGRKWKMWWLEKQRERGVSQARVFTVMLRTLDFVCGDGSVKGSHWRI